LRVGGVGDDFGQRRAAQLCAVDWRISTRAAAPSLMLELAAAVMVPSFLNAGRRVGILSVRIFKGPSSWSMVTSPLRVWKVRG